MDLGLLKGSRLSPPRTRGFTDFLGNIQLDLPVSSSYAGVYRTVTT